MAKLVNLRQFRKKQQREKAESKAIQNRFIFGQTKAEKQFSARQKQKDHLYLNKGQKDED